MVDVEIIIEKGVATITKAPATLKITIVDLDSKEQDHYQGVYLFQRDDLEPEQESEVVG